MALTFDGTGYLKYAGAIATAMPLTMFCHARKTGGGAAQAIMGTGRANAGDPYQISLEIVSGSVYPAATHRTPGSSRSSVGNTIFPSTFIPVTGLFPSTYTQLRYKADGTLAPAETTARTDNLSLHEQFIIGAGNDLATPATKFFIGDVGEPALWSSILSSADNALLEGGALPETVSPGTLIDVWDLLTFQPSGNYIGRVNGHVLVAFGGVTQAAAHPISRVVSDTTAPTLLSATVSNATPTVVTLAMSEAMDTGNVPAASAFPVAGHTVLSVGISGNTISLTCSTAFVNGEAARTVGYAPPGTANARDVAGNLLAAVTAQAITNNVAATDTVAPSFASAQVADAAKSDIVITMNEALAAFTPATSAFAVSGGRTVSAVIRSGATLTVTVNTPYAYGDAITVTYTKPGTNMLQDAAGNQTASFGPSAVTNNIAAPAGATLTSRPFVNNTTTGSVTSASLQANQAGWSMYAYSLATGLIVGAAKTGLTTNASAVLPAQTDAAWVSGTTYACRYYNATTGMSGLQHLTAV